MVEAIATCFYVLQARQVKGMRASGPGGPSPSTDVSVCVENMRVDVRAEVRADGDSQSYSGPKVRVTKTGVKVKMKVRDGLKSELEPGQTQTGFVSTQKVGKDVARKSWELRAFNHDDCYVLIDAFRALSHSARSKADSISSSVSRCLWQQGPFIL